MDQIIFMFVEHLSKNYKEVEAGVWYTRNASSKPTHISEIYKQFCEQIEFKIKK